MPKLQVLSGREELKILNEFGFRYFSQQGSHIKVRHVDEIDRGTLHAIYPQACRFIPEPELRAAFSAD